MAVDGSAVVNYLMQFKGTPYVWGGNSLSSGVDCSGLLQQGFAHFGIDIARVTNDQIGQGKAVDWDNLQVGDAVFFDTDAGRSGPDHVGIYIGNGKMLHAPHTGDVVKVTDITSDYYASRFMGARRFNGVEGGGESNTDWNTQTQTERKLSPEEMSANYGLSYSFLTSEPSLKGIFDTAVKENWTTDMFQAKLKETDFWKNNSEAQRKALEQKASDPATWSAVLDANKQKIMQMANDMGAAIPEGALNKLSEDMAMTAMSDEHLNNVLSGYVDFVNGSLVGQAGMYEQTMRKYASDMGVDLNQQSIKNYAQLMIRGMSAQSDFRNFVNQQAASAYPAYADQINSGMTMKNIANPYIQMMADQLEMNPNTIGLKDPTITNALNGVDQDGKPVGRTLTEFSDVLRGDPRWRSTQAAQDKAMNVGATVLKNWGLISG
jgi:hypothetical protein